jgi:hypothetical protein
MLGGLSLHPPEHLQHLGMPLLLLTFSDLHVSGQPPHHRRVAHPSLLRHPSVDNQALLTQPQHRRRILVRSIRSAMALSHLPAHSVTGPWPFAENVKDGLPVSASPMQ